MSIIAKRIEVDFTDEESRILKAGMPCDTLASALLLRREAMKITREEVEYVAHLARLALGPEEAEKFTGQLDQILQYFEKLNELDTSEVEPTRHATAVVNAFREDEVKPSFDADTALANAPDRHRSFFKVPKIIE